MGDLHLQRETLQTSLKQVQTKLEVMIQEQPRSREQWQAEGQRMKSQLDTYGDELAYLETHEQRRIASLDAQLRQITDQLNPAQERLSVVKRALAQMVAQQVQRQTEKTNCLSQINRLAAQLAEAQQMSTVKRFFKHISPDALAQQLANTQQQLWYYDQILSDLQKHMNEAYFTHSAIDNEYLSSRVGEAPLQSRLRSSIIFKSYELLSATHQIIILAHTDASHRRNGRRGCPCGRQGCRYC